MRRVAFPALLFALSGYTGANAASLPSDAGAHMEAVAPGVYAIIHRDATDEWPHGNTGVVVGENGLLVIDSTYLPSRARADIALIRKLTEQPVRYLVNTHWHFDHNNGAIAYREAYPGLQVISESETRNFIELNAQWWARMSTAPNSARRKALSELEAQLSAGKGADVKAVNREGQTTVDMANGPVQRTQPYPETIKLLEGLGAKNNHKCVSC